MPKNKKDSEKIKRELAAMREMMALNKIVMKDDLEGVFVSNPARESETVSDEVADKILKNLEQSDKKSEVSAQSIVNKFAAGGGEPADHTSAPTISGKSRRRTNRSKKSRRALKVKVKKARR